MSENFPGSCAETVFLPRADARRMVKVVRTLYHLSNSLAYYQQLNNTIPLVAQHRSRHDAVLMGYDFHLSPAGPQLIEVNTNAGGLWLACQSYTNNANTFPLNMASKLLHMFRQEFQQWTRQNQQTLKCVAIVDQDPKAQFLYPEMQAYANLLAQHGIKTFILDPSELEITDTGFSYQNSHIDLIYNRHCDFYLQSATMSAIRAAWLQNQICLTPNPHIYAMLADKRRMINWSTPEEIALYPLTELQQQILTQAVPVTRPLHAMDQQQLWLQRKHWVFKPDTSYASRGVYLGKKITSGTLQALNPQNTLVQEYIAPSQTTSANGQKFKTDFRLFVYRNRTLAIAARLYQGQVTNLRTEGGGFARVAIV